MPGFDACSFAARSGAMFFLARKFERSELWFCDDAISISVAGVPLMKIEDTPLKEGHPITKIRRPHHERVEYRPDGDFSAGC